MFFIRINYGFVPSFEFLWSRNFILPHTIQTPAPFPSCLLYLPTLFVPQPALPQPTSFSFFKNLSEPGIAGRDGGPGRVKTICIDQRHGREGECYVEMQASQRYERACFLLLPSPYSSIPWSVLILYMFTIILHMQQEHGQWRKITGLPLPLRKIIWNTFKIIVVEWL